jgi:hypothetical protein
MKDGHDLKVEEGDLALVLVEHHVVRPVVNIDK